MLGCYCGVILSRLFQSASVLGRTGILDDIFWGCCCSCYRYRQFMQYGLGRIKQSGWNPNGKKKQADFEYRGWLDIAGPSRCFPPTDGPLFSMDPSLFASFFAEHGRFFLFSVFCFLLWLYLLSVCASVALICLTVNVYSIGPFVFVFLSFVVVSSRQSR